MSEPIARKELELRLKLVADMAGGTRSMREFGDATEKVEKSLSKAQKALGGDGKGGGGGLGFWGEFGKAAGGGPNARGFGGELGATLGGYARALGPIALAMHSLQASKAAAAILHDERLSPDQAGRAAIRGTLPFGETALDYLDTWSGRKRAMAREEERARIMSAETEGRTGLMGVHTGLARELDPIYARQRQLAGAQPVLMPDIDRRTAAGERMYQLESRLLPVKEKMAAAERSAAESAEVQAKSESRQLEFAARAARIEHERAGIRKDLEGLDRRASSRLPLAAWATSLAVAPGLTTLVTGLAGDQGVARQALLARDQDLLKQSAAMESIRAEEARARFGAARQAALAKAEVTGAKAEVARIHAGQAEERAATAGSSAQRLLAGGQNRAYAGFQALQFIQTHGAENATPEIIEAANFVAPRTAGKLLEAGGARHPLYQLGVGLAPEDYPAGGPQAERDRSRELTNEAAKLQLQADKEAADKVAGAGTTLGKEITEIFKGHIDRFKAAVIDEIRRGLDH